ncbi:MAG: hypothetical protein RLY87_1596 [Chloroflexota bacterium]|jgi:ribosomal protein S18 acetylase RimI-like enzyme
MSVERPDITIRRANAGDIDALVAVHSDAFHDKFLAAFGTRKYATGVTLMQDIWRRQGSAGLAGIWVAEVDQRIVATIAMRARITSRALPLIPVEWMFIRALGVFRAFYALTALSLVDYHMSANEIYISDVAVHHAYRRRGIANALLSHAVSEAQRLAIGSLCLFVSAANPAAIALYQNMGFLIVGKRISLFGWVILGNRQWHLMRKMVPRQGVLPALVHGENEPGRSPVVE